MDLVINNKPQAPEKNVTYAFLAESYTLPKLTVFQLIVKREGDKPSYPIYVLKVQRNKFINVKTLEVMKKGRYDHLILEDSGHSLVVTNFQKLEAALHVKQ